MIPRTIVARPDDLESDPLRGYPADPDIIPLPGGRRAERDSQPSHGAVTQPRATLVNLGQESAWCRLSS